MKSVAADIIRRDRIQIKLEALIESVLPRDVIDKLIRHTKLAGVEAAPFKAY